MTEKLSDQEVKDLETSSQRLFEVLRYIEENQPVKAIYTRMAENFEFSSGTVNSKVDVLVDEGLVLKKELDGSTHLLASDFDPQLIDKISSSIAKLRKNEIEKLEGGQIKYYPSKEEKEDLKNDLETHLGKEISENQLLRALKELRSKWEWLSSKEEGQKLFKK